MWHSTHEVEDDRRGDNGSHTFSRWKRWTIEGHGRTGIQELYGKDLGLLISHTLSLVGGSWLSSIVKSLENSCPGKRQNQNHASLDYKLADLKSSAFLLFILFSSILRSGESIRLPPLWPGIDSDSVLYILVWVYCCFSSYKEGFSPGSPLFLSKKNQHLQIPARPRYKTHVKTI